MTRPRIRKLLTFLIVFGVLLLIWQGALFLALLRPALITVGVVQPAPQATEGFAYPALGITAPVTVAPSTSPLEAKDWADIRRALTAGLSLAFDAPTLDDARLAFVTGHSSDTYPHPYSTVFAPLGQARVDDRFAVTIGEASRTYRVIVRQVIPPAAVERFTALGPPDGQPARVALVTCWPPLTTNQRLVIVGEQVVE
ncbi:sortase [Candidatus Berkelbacteria bacterium]|nr:sortase [Candidatus Berkelbacteria bacterium]